ncbi:MAG TPA: nucleotidyltransferase family protein [Terriglobales bacterium]|nr:nucleotidyltransferase family protein [Terriglobales bacterium]
MKAFLLAAGVGSRLRPLTDKIPKCLVPIRGKPLLEIWLELLQRFGISEVLINAHAHADMIGEFAARRFAALKVMVSHEPQLLGSAGTLRANREWTGSDPCFWVLYADVLTNVNLEEMQKFHKERATAATLGVYSVADPSRCGIVGVAPDGRIEQFIEKPKNPSGNLAFAGILIGTQTLMDAIPDKLPADVGFDVLPQLVGRMHAYPINDFLLDIGTLENYERAQKSWPGC